MSIRVGITGHTGSLGKEIIKSKLGFNYSFLGPSLFPRLEVLTCSTFKTKLIYTTSKLFL